MLCRINFIPRTLKSNRKLKNSCVIESIDLSASNDDKNNDIQAITKNVVSMTNK